MVRTSRNLLAGFAIATVVPLTLSCGGDSPDAGGLTVRDSVGIRIVEIGPMPDEPGPWSVLPDPILRVGWSEGGPQFEFIRSGVLSGGRAIVGDMRTNAVTVIPLDGGEVVTLGGPGEGPGEFGRVGHVLAAGGDSILVSDSGNLRVTWFVGGGYSSDRRFQSMNADAEAIYEPVSRTSGGSFILIPAAFVMRVDQEPGWEEYPVFGTDDFSVLKQLASLPLMHFGEPGNIVVHRGAVFAVGDGFGHAQSDRPEVLWRDADGTVTQIARWPATLREATDEDWAAWESNYRSRTSPGGDPDAYEQRVREFREDFGGTVPLFEGGRGDEWGNVWLSEQTFSGIPASFHVLASSGEWVGRVEFPRPITILDFAGDLVLGVERDELDIQGVVVYRIDRADG